MAGHSQFKNIMYRKGAQDKKRAKVFTKIIRELTTAARTGLPDPAANPRLRAAVLAALTSRCTSKFKERYRETNHPHDCFNFIAAYRNVNNFVERQPIAATLSGFMCQFGNAKGRQPVTATLPEVVPI